MSGRSASLAGLRGRIGPRLERVLQRAGYERVQHPGGPERSQTAEDATIPRGLREPFTTDEYDVLPRGAYQFVAADYYSPIPDVGRLGAEDWERESELRGVPMDVEGAIGFAEHHLAPAIAELDVPAEDPGVPNVFFTRNTAFESVDSELLYGMVRTLRPQRVVELGSGYSSLIINMAAARNADEGAATAHTAYDPYPRPHVTGEGLRAPSSLVPIGATDVPMDVFDALEAGDVLFVDSTHTVKLGSDVNFVILDVLPRLRPGVVIHFHDIFLPWEYPRVWFEQFHYYWAEQYLLQAFLAFNSTFGVVLPAQAVARRYPERLSAIVPTFGPGVSPASMWLVRTEPAEDGLALTRRLMEIRNDARQI